MEPSGRDAKVVSETAKDCGSVVKGCGSTARVALGSYVVVGKDSEAGLGSKPMFTGVNMLES